MSVTWTNTPSPDDRERWERLRRMPANRTLFEIVKYLVMPSELIGQWLREHSGDCDCEFCNSGVHVEEIADALQALNYVLTMAASTITSCCPGSPPCTEDEQRDATTLRIKPVSDDGTGPMRNAL